MRTPGFEKQQTYTAGLRYSLARFSHQGVYAQPRVRGRNGQRPFLKAEPQNAAVATRGGEA